MHGSPSCVGRIPDRVYPRIVRRTLHAARVIGLLLSRLRRWQPNARDRGWSRARPITTLQTRRSRRCVCVLRLTPWRCKGQSAIARMWSVLPTTAPPIGPNIGDLALGRSRHLGLHAITSNDTHTHAREVGAVCVCDAIADPPTPSLSPSACLLRNQALIHCLAMQATRERMQVDGAASLLFREEKQLDYEVTDVAAGDGWRWRCCLLLGFRAAHLRTSPGNIQSCICCTSATNLIRSVLCVHLHGEYCTCCVMRP